MTQAMTQSLAEAARLQQLITEYLTNGGLFNPELANHDAVRDLLIGCRDALAARPVASAESELPHSAESIERAILTLREITQGLRGRGISAVLMLEEQLQAALAARPVAQADAGAAQSTVAASGLFAEKVRAHQTRDGLRFTVDGGLSWFKTWRADGVPNGPVEIRFATPALAASAQATQSNPELCPYCDGSGESTALDGGGPDAQEVSITCPRCKGQQTLRAAYDTLAEELPPLQLKVAQLGIFHSHATRYGWAPNQKDGMQSFEKLAAEWLAENGAQATQADDDDGMTREQWLAAAERVYLAAGDHEDEAKRLAAYQWSQLDPLTGEIDDPYEAALEDIEGRPATQAVEPVANRCPTCGRLDLASLSASFANADESVDYAGKHPAPTTAQAVEPACEWSQDGNEDGSWFSACGGDPWYCEADDPTKNGMRFCIHCGKRMVQRPATQEGGQAKGVGE